MILLDGETAAGDESLLASSRQACTAQPWFLAYTRPQLEAVAVQNLALQNFDAYLPLYKRLKKLLEGGSSVISEPMFPRYVFFRPTRPTQSIAPVRSTRGVSHVVRFGHETATIRPHILDVIRQFEADRNAADVAELSALRPGDKVRFSDPAFKRLEGLVKSVSSRRVSVLLELVGRPQVVKVEHHRLDVL